MKLVNWQGTDGTDCKGFEFPCGRKYNAEYFTRTEAINAHIPICKICRDNVLASADLAE